MSLFHYLSFLFIQHFLFVKCDAQPAPLDIPPPPPELVPGLYIFGDSYVDVGLNSKLDTLMTATYSPYGIDFAIGATGRFTNGGTIMDYLDRDLGLPTTVCYMSEQFLNNQVTTGFNYASGSAGILHKTGRSLGDNWSMGKQIAMFNKTVRENLPSNFKGTAELSEYLSKCLFIHQKPTPQMVDSVVAWACRQWWWLTARLVDSVAVPASLLIFYRQAWGGSPRSLSTMLDSSFFGTRNLTDRPITHPTGWLESVPTPLEGENHPSLLRWLALPRSLPGLEVTHGQACRLGLGLCAGMGLG
uniref:GDSL esterase/lipase n=1 Tax=Fagus sylvatica TaxID=28930 RepID=A0A2N9J9A1_FAGSY